MLRICPVVHREKEEKIDRTIVVINGYGFYKSSRKSSGLSDIWLPFTYVRPSGRLEKPDFPQFFFERSNFLAPNVSAKIDSWFGSNEVLNEWIGRNPVFAHFGNLEAMLISFALDSVGWEKNFDAYPDLNELASLITLDTNFFYFVLQLRDSILMELPTQLYDADKPEEMIRLNQYLLSHGLKYHNGGPAIFSEAAAEGKISYSLKHIENENLFPRYTLEMQKRIECGNPHIVRTLAESKLHKARPAALKFFSQVGVMVSDPDSASQNATPRKTLTKRGITFS